MRKLTIKNYEKIIGRKLNTESDWEIKAVIQKEDRYVFKCFKMVGLIKLCELELSRESDAGVFYFIPDRMFGVTADWIGDMDNIVNMISEQVESFEDNN